MSWALASPAAKRRVPILLAVLLTVFGFVYCLLSVTTQCPLRIAHAEPIHSTTSVLADALTLRVGNYSATLPDINPLKSILSVTSATAASLLFAVVAFLYNLRVRIYESYSRVYVTYVQSMTRFERKLHEELKPFSAPHTLEGGKGKLGKTYLQWKKSSYAGVPESTRKFFDPRSFYTELMDIGASAGLNMSISPKDQPFDFESETQRKKLIARLMKHQENSVWVETHHKNNVLTIQSAMLSTVPGKARETDRMIRRLICGITLFVAAHASSIVWIVSDLYQVGIVCLILYTAGWALAMVVILELRSYTPKPKIKKGDYFKKYDKVTLPEQAIQQST